MGVRFEAFRISDSVFRLGFGRFRIARGSRIPNLYDENPKVS